MSLRLSRESGKKKWIDWKQRKAVQNLSKQEKVIEILLMHVIESLVQSGHAEIEANKILYIYGNALEVL